MKNKIVKVTLKFGIVFFSDLGPKWIPKGFPKWCRILCARALGALWGALGPPGRVFDDFKRFL